MTKKERKFLQAWDIEVSWEAAMKENEARKMIPSDWDEAIAENEVRESAGVIQ